MRFFYKDKKTMSFCSFASLLGGACGVSSENPNVVDFSI